MDVAGGFGGRGCVETVHQCADQRHPGWIGGPDNQRIAYLSLREGKTEVWLVPFLGGGGQMVKTLDARPRWLTSWTADGAHLYFEADNNLFALAVRDGLVHQVTSFPATSSKSEFAVSVDGRWLAYQEKVAGIDQLFVAPLNGGIPEQITHEGSRNVTPLWLPDNERLVYPSTRNGVQQICVASRRGGQPVQLTSGPESRIPWEVTAAGDKIFYFSQREESDLYLFDLANNTERRFSTEVLQEFAPVFAPDGKTAVFMQSSGFELNETYQSDIFSHTITGGEPLRLPTNGFDVRWSPRGNQLAFLHLREPGKLDAQLWVMRSDGAAAQPVINEQVFFLGYIPAPFSWSWPPNYSWSPDGQRLTYGSTKDGALNLYTVALDGSGETRLTDNTNASFRLACPLWSPDGRRLAYLGRGTGTDKRSSVWLLEGTRSQMIWQTPDELRMLGWSPAGDQLYVSAMQPPRQNAPVEVKVISLWPERQTAREVARFADTYFANLVLAPNARQVAYVVRQENADNLWLASLTTGQRRRLTANADPNLNYGSLSWSPQSNLLGFTKQSNATSIMAIENFR